MGVVTGEGECHVTSVEGNRKMSRGATKKQKTKGVGGGGGGVSCDVFDGNIELCQVRL